MDVIKVGQRYRWNPDDCTILEREDHFILSKLVSDNGLISYDISTISHTPNGDEFYSPSLNRNGLYEPTTGATKQPLPFEAMKARFDEIVANDRKVKASQKAADEARETAFSTRLWKIQQAKELRAAAEKTIAEVMGASRSVERAVNDPRIIDAVEQISIINATISYIR
jgi:hypothetical protein